MIASAWWFVLASVFCRLSYFGFLTTSLWIQSRRSNSDGPSRYKVFHRKISFLQTLDGLVFVGACVVSRNTYHVTVSPWWPIGIGMFMIIVGVATKLWAVSYLGTGSYTWKDFFVPEKQFSPCRLGPYRWIRDPMYTIGYLQTYGTAFVFLSWPGLLLSVFMQTTMLILSDTIEKRHLSRLIVGTKGLAPQVDHQMLER